MNAAKVAEEEAVRPLNPETRNPQPETRNPMKPESRNPKPETRSPKPGARNLKPETRNLKSETGSQVFLKAIRADGINPEAFVDPAEVHLNLHSSKPETRNPKPETRDPKPETRNQKPRNPKPDIWFHLVAPSNRISIPGAGLHRLCHRQKNLLPRGVRYKLLNPQTAEPSKPQSPVAPAR